MNNNIKLTKINNYSKKYIQNNILLTIVVIIIVIIVIYLILHINFNKITGSEIIKYEVIYDKNIKEEDLLESNNICLKGCNNGKCYKSNNSNSINNCKTNKDCVYCKNLNNNAFYINKNKNILNKFEYEENYE